MKIRITTTNSLLVAMLGLSCLQPVLNASADTVESQTRQEVKDLKATLKRLKRLVAKSSGRKVLGTLAAPGLADSDDDGLPDVYENALGSSACDSDSDSDGISDGDEGKSGSKPDDSNSGEIEAKGSITAITSTTVTVGGNIYVATPSTAYLKGATSLASFAVGNFVELKGRLKNGILELIKIKAED